MEIMNCTPHQICIYAADGVSYDPTTRKHYLTANSQLIDVIAPSGNLLNVRYKEEFVGDINGIPVKAKRVADIDPIPPHAEAVVVSNQYASAALQLNIDRLDRLYTIGDPVYESKDNPRPVGCLCLIKVK